MDNFQTVDENCINLCLNTIQGLHTSLNVPKENAVTYDDFAEHRVVLISDEAHHTNTATKKGKNTIVDSSPTLPGIEVESTEDWESTVMKIFIVMKQTSYWNLQQRRISRMPISQISMKTK